MTVIHGKNSKMMAGIIEYMKMLMGLFSNLLSATVKTALTPIAVVKDAVNVAIGEEADETKNLIESAGEDVMDAIDDASEGEILF